MNFLFRVLKLPLVILNWLKWLFVTEEIAYLSFLMLALEFLGAIKAGLDLCPCKCICLCQLLNWDAWIESFVRLFSVEKASQNWFTMLLFFVTWLVGGGALVSVMVGRFYKKAAGEFRWWPCLIDNHVVVLGWDDGVLMELVLELKKTSSKCFVITSMPVKNIERSLESAGASVSQICVYHGNYDDEREWKYYLKIKDAKRVFIMGEREEEAHDARVRMLFDKVKNAVNMNVTGDKRTSKEIEKIKVNIHDFGLARKLIRNGEMGENPYVNFHLNWANALWCQLKPNIMENIFDLYIVGFGAMGKAIAITAVEKCRLGGVYVSDDDEKKFTEERTRFVRQFGDSSSDENNPTEGFASKDSSLTTVVIQKSKDGSVTIVKRMQKDIMPKVDVRFQGVTISFEKWDDMLKKIRGYANNSGGKGEDRKIVIVVAKKRSEKGMLCMMDIVRQFGDSVSKNVQLVLDQEIDGYSVDLNRQMYIGNNIPVQLFGMKRGCKWST